MADQLFRARLGLIVNNNLLFANNGRVAVNSNSLGVTFGVNANDGVQLPTGNTGQRPFTAGVLRFNSETLQFEGAINSTAYTIFSGVQGLAYNSGTDTLSVTAINFLGGVAVSRFGNSTTNVVISNTGIAIANATQTSALNPGFVSLVGGGTTNVSGAGYIGGKVNATDLIVNSVVLVTNGASVGVGNNTPADKLHVQGNIVATGDVTTAFSDKRLKKNIVQITGALDIVDKISGIYYVPNHLAKKTGYADTARQIGVLAHEVEEVLPEVVKIAAFDRGPEPLNKDGNRYKTVQYDRIIPVLIEAIKELRKEIEALKKNDSKGQCDCSCR